MVFVMTDGTDNGSDVATEVRRELCGPGGPWETTTEDVLGEASLVFRNRHRSLSAMLEADCRRYADRECLILGDERVTYAELATRVAATAKRLHDEFGIGPGDRVGILAANSPSWVVTLFATTSLGAIAAALNGWWTATEIDQAIELTAPKLLVGDTRRLARAGALPDDLPVVSTLR